MRRLIGLWLLLLLSSCSQETVVDAFIRERDKVQVLAFVEALRDGEMEKADSYIIDGPNGELLRRNLTQYPIKFPKQATFRVMGYFVIMTPNGPLKRVVLMTEYKDLGGPKWISTDLEYTHNAKYPQIIAVYNVVSTRYSDLPPHFKEEQQFNHMANKVKAVLFLLFLCVIGAVVFIVRRMRASR